jgi:spore germination protein YaaH
MPLQRFKHRLLTLIALQAVLVCLAPGTAVAGATPVPTPPSDSTHPMSMQQAATKVSTAATGPLTPFAPLAPQAAVGGAGGLEREVFGFALASSLADPTFGYPTWNFSLVSTVAFFGLHVQDDGTFAADSGMSVWNSSQLTGLLSTAHAHGTKVVVTVILQDFGAGTPHMCAGLSHTSTTVANTVAEMKAKGVDGVNLDYEGLNGSCGTGDPSWARHAMTGFAGSLRAAMPAGSYLSVDTYASSATDSLGFFDVPGLGASVDSFFVMAYDLEYSNYARAPTNCSTFCLGPTAPLTGYYYNDTSTAAQYVAAVPSSKVILGVPYYGRKACVGAGTPNAYPTSGVVADTYLDASGEAGSNLVKPGSYGAHRDANDPSGQERWDTWFNTSMNCTRELYWDDVTSLGQKYALVNADNLRGVGIWNLNYGGGAPELWSTLSTYFGCPVTLTIPATEATTEFSVGLSAPGCSVASFEVEQSDSTLNQGWSGLGLAGASGGSASMVAEGFQGHTYQFRARAHTTAGVVGQWSLGTTAVSSTATLSHPFTGLYTLDGWGGVHADSSPPLSGGAYWQGWNIARAAHARPGASAPQSGLELDGWGGLHPYGPGITSVTTTGYWRNWDIARDFAFLPDGTGGFVLDGWGGLHAFRINGNSAPLVAQGGAYWQGWDIARKVVIFPDGTGGYVLDGWGGVHAFGINGPPPATTTKVTTTGYWPYWDIARDIVLVPGNGNHSGYVLDGWGGIHPFHPSGDGSTMPGAIKGAFWQGWDIARAMWLLPGSATAGYTLDGWGGLHPFGGAPQLANTATWPGWDIAKSIWGA